MAGDLDYCAGQIRTHDEDLGLSLRYCPAADQDRLAAILAIQIELRRIPSIVSEPPLGEIRLQWWREALDEIVAGRPARAHPAVSLLAACGGFDAGARALAERLIDARARLLYEPQFSSLDDLRNFLKDAEAPLALLSIHAASDIAAEDAAMLGEAYALARFAPVLAPALAREAAAEASRLLSKTAGRGFQLSPADAGRLAFLSLTRGYAGRADGRQWPVLKRLAMVRTILTGRL